MILRILNSALTHWDLWGCTRIGQSGARRRNPLSPELKTRLHRARKSLTDHQETELFRLIRSEPKATRLLIYLLYATGCRISEALALTAECIDTEDGLIVFHTLKQRDHDNLRAVPVPVSLACALADLAMDPQRRIWEFSRWTARRRVQALLLQAGVPSPLATTKIFRHSYNDRGKQAGTPDHVRRALLGHRSQSSNAHYGLLVGDELLAHARNCWGLARSTRLFSQPPIRFAWLRLRSR